MAKIILIVVTGFFLGLIIVSFQKPSEKNIVSPKKVERTWQIKAIDTMKYSRDPSLEKLHDYSFDLIIDSHIRAIKAMNANYVAIATPYDKTFIPMLERWVKAARKYNLHVWFRGNFSGWEGWFGVNKPLTRDQHLAALKDFISSNPNLFKDGDAFSPCPECENGGPGDPRATGDLEGFRSFMIAEKTTSDEEFKKINKKIITNLASMNFDVAKIVMNKETAKAMGGVVAIDHYVLSPARLAEDIDELASTTGAKIFLGEIGVPIPDIHGTYTEEAQAVWIEDALNLISRKPYVIGLNYWVAVGGSTSLLKDNLEPKKASEVIKKHFSLKDFN